MSDFKEIAVTVNQRPYWVILDGLEPHSITTQLANGRNRRSWLKARGREMGPLERRVARAAIAKAKGQTP